MLLKRLSHPYPLAALLSGAAAAVLLVTTAAPGAGGSSVGPVAADPHDTTTHTGAVISTAEHSALLGDSAGSVNSHGGGISGFQGTGRKPGEPIPPETFPALPTGDPETFPENGTDTVIPPDLRHRAQNREAYPARTVVMINRVINGVETRHCSGWMLGPDVVATAGHCVFNRLTRDWYPMGQFRVWPGYDGNGTTKGPWGACTARILYSVVGWTQQLREEFDYGAIKLNCEIGNNVGWPGFWWQTAPVPEHGLIHGYPCDKPFGQLWGSEGITVISQTEMLFYEFDTFNCNSGSPVWTIRSAGSAFCVGWCNRGTHTQGLHGSGIHGQMNHGKRITQPYFDNLRFWRSALSG